MGEFLGTFILVFIGCGAISLSLLFGFFNSLIAIALIWGMGVALAIYLTRSYSSSHLNPAVSFASYLLKEISFKRFLLFSIIQWLGALVAAVVLFLIFNSAIQEYELVNHIVRGSKESYRSAIMFGEFYPNPGAQNITELSEFRATVFEGVGTFFLVFIILLLNFVSDKFALIKPIIIGATVTVIICFVAPYTQAGLNPARDFGPRIMAYIGGWSSAAFPIDKTGFLTVYILGPLTGASIAVGFYRLITVLKKVRKNP